jgi:hypothetical protein
MRKYKSLILVFFFLGMIHSCGLREKNLKSQSTSHKAVGFEFVKDYVLPNYSGFAAARIRVKKTDSLFCIIPITQSVSDSLMVYDFNKQRITIDIPIPERKRIYDIYFHNTDSIFILFQPDRNFHDNTLFLINNEGRIGNNYKLNGADIISSYNPDYNQNSVRYIRFYSELCYENNSLFFHTKKLKDGNTFIGEKKTGRKPFTGIGSLNTDNHTFEYFEELIYPNIHEDIYYPDGYGHPFITLTDNEYELLVSFRYTPKILRYNYKDRTIKDVPELKSFFIDTIKAFKTIPEGRYVNNRFSYLETIYDSKYKRFFRTLGFPQYLNKRSLLAADSAFNVLWEGLMPDNTGFVAALSDSTFLFYNGNKSKNTSDFVLSEYRIIDSAQRTEDMLEYVKSQSFDSGVEPIEKYIEEKLQFDDSATAVVIIPTSNCEAVSYRLLNFYAVNYKILSQKPIYYVMAGEQTTESNELLKKTSLSKKASNIYFDNTSEYYKYCKPAQLNKPRLILFDEDNLVQDITYDALNVYSFEPEILSFLKQHGIISGYYRE